MISLSPVREVMYLVIMKVCIRKYFEASTHPEAKSGLSSSESKFRRAIFVPLLGTGG